MRTKLWTSLALGAFALSSPACVDVDEPPLDDDDDREGEITPLSGARSSLFGAFEVGATWNKDNLTVCWMDNVLDGASADDHTLMDAGKAAVLDQWGRFGRVRFNSVWGRCADTPGADIRIGRVTTENTLGRSAIGTDALAIPADQPTMILNFAIDTYGTCDGPVIGALCKEANPIALDSYDIDSFEHIMLHEFGHALGLRHEHARDDSTCNVDEELDIEYQGTSYDGEPLWAYDSSSVMNYCVATTQLSVGDIRALNTLYPGVVALFRGDNLTSAAVRVGPGVYTAAAQSGAQQIATLGETSGIIVPPGLRAKICTSTVCSYLTSSIRTLSATYNNRLVSVTVEPWVIGADQIGYNGTSESFGLGVTTASGFQMLGDNMMSSVFVPPTRAVTIYASASIDTPSSGPYVGGALGGPIGYKLPLLLDNQVSRVSVAARVVTYAGPFQGTSYALSAGTYRASSNAPWLTSVSALAISGLEVRACTQEGTFGQGAGSCWTYTQSVDLSAAPPTFRYLKVSVPLGNGL